MIRAARLGLLLVFLVVLQTSLMPHLRVADVVPDLGLVAAVALAIRFGPELGATFGFAAGLATDLFLQTPLGLAAFAFGFTALIVGILQSRPARPVRSGPPSPSLPGSSPGSCSWASVRSSASPSCGHWSIRTILLSAAYDGVVAVDLPAGRGRGPSGPQGTTPLGVGMGPHVTLLWPIRGDEHHRRRRLRCSARFRASGISRPPLTSSTSPPRATRSAIREPAIRRILDAAGQRARGQPRRTTSPSTARSATRTRRVLKKLSTPRTPVLSSRST